MSGARGRSFRVAASIALALLLVLFARHVDWRAAMAAARGADPRLLVLAFLCNQLSLVIKGVRWWVFLRPLGVRSLSLVLRATYAGASLNNLVVAQGGEAARVLLVARGSGVSASRVTSALALERVLDGVSYLVLLTSAAFLLDVPENIARWRIPATVALLFSMTALVTLATSSKSAPAETLHATTLWERVLMSIRRFASSVSETASPVRLATAMLFSLCAWALQVATYHTIARATQLPLSLAGSVTAMLAVGLSFLFRATPGNVGVFQAIYATVVVTFGVSRPAAVATAILIQAVQIVPTVLAGTVAAHRLAAGRGVLAAHGS